MCHYAAITQAFERTGQITIEKHEAERLFQLGCATHSNSNCMILEGASVSGKKKMSRRHVLSSEALMESNMHDDVISLRGSAIFGGGASDAANLVSLNAEGSVSNHGVHEEHGPNRALLWGGYGFYGPTMTCWSNAYTNAYGAGGAHEAGTTSTTVQPPPQSNNKSPPELVRFHKSRLSRPMSLIVHTATST